MEVILGVLLGWAIAASVLAGFRLIRPPRVISNEQRAMQEALHAATATLPHLRRGLSADSAAKTVGHLRTLTQALAVALVDHERVLAFAGAGFEHHDDAEWLALTRQAGRDDRLHVESRIRCQQPGCPIGGAVLAPLVVQGERVGTLLALFNRPWRLTPEETRTVGDAASLVTAELQLAEFEAQSERLARAELHALRAQISPHFVYNALAAIAGYIHSNPEEARELLTEFAEFTRYAFRGRHPYVTLADELNYVEKYLRLERARFGSAWKSASRSPQRSCMPSCRCCPCSPWWRTPSATASNGAGGAGWRSSRGTSRPMWSCGSPTTAWAWRTSAPAPSSPVTARGWG